MDFMAGISSIIGTISFVVFFAGVVKVFQMAATLTEIKDVLNSIKLNGSLSAPIRAAVATPRATPTIISPDLSGEEMLRALSEELDHPVPPTVVEHKHEN